MDFQDTIELLKNAFLGYEDFVEKYWSKDELLNAKKLSQIYQSSEWIKYGRK